MAEVPYSVFSIQLSNVIVILRYDGGSDKSEDIATLLTSVITFSVQDHP
jgi:hypothetical protein